VENYAERTIDRPSSNVKWFGNFVPLNSEYWVHYTSYLLAKRAKKMLNHQ